MTKLWARIALGFAVALTLIVLIAAAWIAHFRGSLPDYNGTVQVQGLSAPVRILRDEHAVPHIFAKSRADALFGLGYAAAQDRLWQMQFVRRVMKGRLAEMVGAAGIRTDTFIRTLGFIALPNSPSKN